MSRLDDLGEILDEAESRGNAAQAPKKEWKHAYETIDNKTETIALPETIKGKFIYQDEKNTVKVSYIGTYVAGAPELAKVEDIQVQLYGKETPEKLESLVTLKSNEVYKKKQLVLYVSKLLKIEEETADEKQEFKDFRSKFLIGLKEVIRKIIEDAQSKNFFDRFDLNLPKYKDYISDPNFNYDPFSMIGQGGHGRKFGTGIIGTGKDSKDYSVLGGLDLQNLEELYEKYKNIKINLIEKEEKDVKYKTLEELLANDLPASQNQEPKLITPGNGQKEKSYLNIINYLTDLEKKHKNKHKKPDDDEDSDDGKGKKSN